MQVSRPFILAAIAGLLILGFFLVFHRPGASLSQTSSNQPADKKSQPPTPTSSFPGSVPASLSSPSPENGFRSESPALAAIESAIAALRKGTPEENAATLAKLQQELESLSSREAIAAVRKFLESGQDAATGLAFVVGSGGALDSAPTLRVFLLDELAALAKAGGDPQASLSVARQVLDTPTTPDEWAVAMRNVAWADKNSANFLNEKFKELVSNPDWAKNPSTGLLEAFDIPVFTHDTSAIPWLASVLPQQGNPESRAAAVALDRMAEQAPLGVMAYLNANPSTLADKPMLRADYFTKADLTDPAQKAAVESYLARGDVTATEKSKVVEGLACPGSFVSDNLLTVSTPPDSDARLRALEKAAADWQSRFPAVAAQLKTILSNIQQP
ncbi:MAG: hypothetical protein WCP06_12180 [Verrucomicrobiota bacterium]